MTAQSSDGAARRAERADERRMALAREWDELVERVRGTSGFEDFLRPPGLDDLLPAARGGPVVLVNISRWRCDAVIVTLRGVRVTPLGDLTSAEVQQRAEGYLALLRAVEQAVRELLLARRAFENSAPTLEATRRHSAASRALRQARDTMESGLTDLAAWMGDRITGPALETLGIHDAPAPGEAYPRVWWCPTGLLNLLPLHAAGHHSPAPAGVAPRTVIDRAVSSYTPTLRALLEASRPGRPPGHGDPRMLVVALAETPGELPLPAVNTERDLLTGLFADRHTLLEGRAATWDAVRAGPARHPWVHFSCHGDQDLSDPSRGGLLLSDRVLTVQDVAAGHHRGEFAFLSACKTATGGLTLTDEVITLAAALHDPVHRIPARHRHPVVRLRPVGRGRVRHGVRGAHGGRALLPGPVRARAAHRDPATA
ncbi:CHAT domain-containing protein [Streptomyces sp. NBC_01232]|nr:CHAT domain-containing protein [Streptomyces sp. NBC_01232]